MTASRCEITDLLADSCGHCNGAEARARREEAAVSRPSGAGPGPWFTAQYGGECACCGDDICPGDTIRADGEGGYACNECRGCSAGGPHA
jgi:hypothetical protein